MLILKRIKDAGFSVPQVHESWLVAPLSPSNKPNPPNSTITTTTVSNTGEDSEPPSEKRMDELSEFFSLNLHQYEQSLETTRKMSGVLTTDIWRTFYHLVRAANFAQLEQFEAAQGSVNAALKINPKLSLSAMRKRFEGSNNHPENRDFWLASLRKAGLPE